MSISKSGTLKLRQFNMDNPDITEIIDRKLIACGQICVVTEIDRKLKKLKFDGKFWQNVADVYEFVVERKEIEVSLDAHTEDRLVSNYYPIDDIYCVGGLLWAIDKPVKFFIDTIKLANIEAVLGLDFDFWKHLDEPLHSFITYNGEVVPILRVKIDSSAGEPVPFYTVYNPDSSDLMSINSTVYDTKYRSVVENIDNMVKGIAKFHHPSDFLKVLSDFGYQIVKK